MISVIIYELGAIELQRTLVDFDMFSKWGDRGLLLWQVGLIANVKLHFWLFPIPFLVESKRWDDPLRHPLDPSRKGGRDNKKLGTAAAL